MPLIARAAWLATLCCACGGRASLDVSSTSATPPVPSNSGASDSGATGPPVGTGSTAPDAAGSAGASSSPGGDSSVVDSAADAGEDEGATATAASASSMCQQVASTLCSRESLCAGGIQGSDCEAQLSLEFDCDLATAPTFSTCLADSESAACDALYPDGGLTPPQTCLPPITSTPLTDPQTKCYALVDALCAQTIQCMTSQCMGVVATSGQIQDCEDDFTTDLEGGLPCLLAASVGPGYEACLGAIPMLACPGAGGDAAAEPEEGGGATSATTLSACASALVFSP
ncbi:MAG: hypothetical protein ABSF69_14265 [Polyangiaceae bacterium]